MRKIRRALIVPTILQAVGIGAGAAGVGTATPNVLRWSPVPTPNNAYIVVADSVTLGMTFTLNAPGMYSVEMNLGQVASTSLRTGISLNDATVTNPQVGVAGTIAVGGPSTTLALAASAVFLSRTFQISDSAVGAVLRTNASDNAGATPVAAISTAAGVNWLAITRALDAG